MNSKLKEKSMDALLNSGVYKTSLEELLSLIVKEAKMVKNESSLASFFERKLYAFILNFFNVKIEFEKEVGEDILSHKFKGRMDAVSNDLVIEYKHYSNLNSKKNKEDATQQVNEYLTQLNENDNRHNAILLDGTKIKYFYYSNNELISSPFTTLKLYDLDIIIKSLLQVRMKRFVPENIVEDFSLSKKDSLSKRISLELFTNLQETKITSKTQMLFTEWQTLFRLSEGDQGQSQNIVKRRRSLSNIFNIEINNNDLEFKALFSLQTTYAIIVKLIATKVISKLAYADEIVYFDDLNVVTTPELQRFFEHLEDGYVFMAGGIKNLLEGDFFSWYADKNQWNGRLAELIKEVISILELYSKGNAEFGSEPIDIFKDLYMEIIPNEVRHSLGEYFTPSWIADYVTSKSLTKLENSEWRAIDPCCGSGVFIVTLIRKILKKHNVNDLTSKEKSELLNNIINRVSGIDINPLSVLTSRVSYLLAVIPLIDNNEFEIPVYLGDSANIPKKIDVGDIPCYQYSITTNMSNIDVSLPVHFVENDSFLEKMNDLQTYIKAEDDQLVYDMLISYIDDFNKNKALKTSLKTLSSQLVNLHKQEWDGIWVRIVSNFMLVAKTKEMDLIIGNPPWIKWENLPQEYAESIKSLCIDRHIFSGQSYMGAISLNICALIANVTASSWLKKDGMLSFLMPKTMMTQDSFEGFRNFYTDFNANQRMYLQEIDDWSRSGNPFIYTQEKFLTYYYHSNPVDYTGGLPINYINKKRSSSIKTINMKQKFEDVEKYFDVKIGTAFQLDEKRTGFTMIETADKDKIEKFRLIIGESDYRARSGVEFTPREVYMLKGVSPSRNENSYIFSSIKSRMSTYKAVFNSKIDLETKYIYPLIQGPSIKPFRLEENSDFCIFPYDVESKLSVPLQEIKNYPKLLQYLIGYKNLIEGQSTRSKKLRRGQDFYALSKVGEYTFAENLVAFRDNTSMDAVAVFEEKTPWGDFKIPICAKHAPYISMDNDNKFITREEAYYLAGILNTNIVNEYFKATFSERSYSIAFNIKLPKYSKNNHFQRKIYELSKMAHKTSDTNSLNNIVVDIEKSYIELCRTL